MTQSDNSKRGWQQLRDQASEAAPTLENDEFRSPLSFASESLPASHQHRQEGGLTIGHFAISDRDETSNRQMGRPISIRDGDSASIEILWQRSNGGDSKTEQEMTSKEDKKEVTEASRPKRALSSNQLGMLSYTTSDVPSPEESTTAAEPMPKKRIRFMSIDEILTTTKENDTHYVSPTLALESLEELDLQLEEELKGTELYQKSEGFDHHAASNQSPTTALPTDVSSSRVSPVCVPLLTPPQSPRHSIVEWPSNLVIESALMRVANDIRPLSPASLTNENEAEKGLSDTLLADEPITLTKRLSFITVGSN